MGVTDPMRSALPGDVTERVDDLESAGLLGAVLVVALVVRVRALTAESLWMDEVYSITYATERPTLAILTELPLEDPHPPLYYLLLRGWTAVFGGSKVATRSMSLVFGVAAVALLFALGRRLYDRETATIAAAMLALSGMHLYFSQDTRMYSLYTALAVASLYWYVRLVFDGDRSRRTLAGYAAATVLLGYTHVFGLFLILAQNCYLLVHVLRSERSLATEPLRYWAGLQTVTALLLGPFLAVLGMRLLGYPPFDSASPTWIPVPEPGLLVDTVARYFEYGWLWDSWAIGFVAASVALGGWALVSDADPEDPAGRLDRLLPSRRATFLLVVFVVPVVVPFAISLTVEPIYRAKYTAAASIGLFLLVARGISGLRWTNIGAGRFAVAGLLLLAMAASVAVLQGSPQNPQWEGAVEGVERHGDDPHIVVVGGDVPERFYPAVHVAGEESATAVQASEADTLGEVVAERRARGEQVWLLISQWRTDRSQRRVIGDQIGSRDLRFDGQLEYFAVWTLRLGNATDDGANAESRRPADAVRADATLRGG
ncbi:glycosyltransferase family 39 protein [Halosimplex pelagicum]|uniref:Glycosyltransferase family 39 protein n=1 Tax=Halosimplex pelagicum TaxID=869886 RepID=A0A7D5P7M2_9EURY|nr:glycosyltransferase family 39 protein [Halosimplex pelagicum]QLH82846.1 glycosyltransferase family 39 protein [Halosimplex pelagicum]